MKTETLEKLKLGHWNNESWDTGSVEFGTLEQLK